MTEEIEKTIKEINRIRLMQATNENDLDEQIMKLQELLRKQEADKDNNNE